MKRNSQGHAIVPIHLEQGKGRTPGWGGVAKRVHEDFIPTHMASDIMNMTNRQGIQSYNIGTLSTRPGYAGGPKYQLHGYPDTNQLTHRSRLFAKFYPGQTTEGLGSVVVYDGVGAGGGLSDCSVDTVDTMDKTFVLTIAANGTPDTFDWTQNGVSGGTGEGITGAAQAVGTTGLKVKFDATTGHTVGDKFTIDPISTSQYSPKVLKIAGAAGASSFQYYDPTTDSGSGGGTWTNITAAGYTQGSILGLWYPESIVYDVPAGPYFCWVDPVNGLHVYDGTTDTKQAVPKYNPPGGSITGNITGVLWLAQIDGRLVLSGNYVDASQRNVIYYSAAGDYTKWESHTGGGQIPLYADDDENSQTRNITGIVTLHGQLVVFTNDGRFVVSGIGTTNQQVLFYPDYGCVSGKTITKKKNALYWWGKDGAYEWNGNEPLEIGQLIMPELYTLSLMASGTFFSFEYEDQWWTCVRRKDGGYRNFVFDFATRQWFIFNIPMVAAWSSNTGLLDAGYLYFASPEAVGGKYYHYIFGVDPLTSHVAVYADKVTGAAGARTGTAIASYWTSGRMDFDDIFTKNFWLLHARIGTANSTSLSGNGSFTSARVSYNLDDGAGFSDHLDFTTSASTPYHALSFAGTGDVENPTIGTLLQIKINVSATKRLDLKKVFIEFRPSAIMKNET